MKKRLLSLLLCLCLVVSVLAVTASAAAIDVSVTEANYYDNGDLHTLTVSYGWDSGSATSRVVLMTERLRSAGEHGTYSDYGDFTNLGYYGGAYSSWDEVVDDANSFGMLYFTEEKQMTRGEINSFTIEFAKGNISLDNDQTIYLYLWTYYGGRYYPDNLLMVLQVEDGVLEYAEATDRNDYGRFTTLREMSSAPSAGGSANPNGNHSAPALSQGGNINFIDVYPGDYFAEAVKWAVGMGITNGTDSTPGWETFSPNMTCSRAHIITFLWRAAGSPESSMFNAFYDVYESDWYYKAALWALEEGIIETGGYFSPNTPCTRGSTVDYFWKFAWCPYAESVPFSDVPAGNTLASAVSWAVDYGITNGTGGTTFTPDQIVTRGQIVTFLYRYFVEPVDNSNLIATLRSGSSGGNTGSSGYSEQLDPLPPEDYTLQADWYLSLTPTDKMSDERLIAEQNNIAAVIKDWRARDIFITDSVYARELDLWVAAFDRGLQ